MQVTGFTFIRNAVIYDYPVIEAIRSILPICDKFIVAVGDSEDNTLSMIKAIDTKKIKIIETVWDTSLKKYDGFLAAETDKAFQQIASSSDWAFYIQADEVIHEKYLDTIYANMQKYKDDPTIDGLLLNYLHFYGSYDYVGASLRWYDKEIRVIKNNKNIYAYRGAQGFRKDRNKKLNVKLIDAYVYHYGWVKNPEKQQRKQLSIFGLVSDAWKKEANKKSLTFNYQRIDALSLFKGTHPKVMVQKIAQQNWTFMHDVRCNQFSLKTASSDG